MYPFPVMVGKRSVRGMRAYEYAKAQVERKHGIGHLGVWLMCYRTLFHILGSVAFIALAVFVVREFIGVERALYALLGALTAFITYQEFYLHPRYYHQLFRKGVLDWFAWVVPIGLYLFFFAS